MAERRKERRERKREGGKSRESSSKQHKVGGRLPLPQRVNEYNTMRPTYYDFLIVSGIR